MTDSWQTLTRRTFSTLSASASLLALAPGLVEGSEAWNSGRVRHLLPGVSHDTILLKASFLAPLTSSPTLAVGDLVVSGEASGTTGRFWRFLAPGLTPGTTYQLSLAAQGEKLCDDWPLRTLPHPDSSPDHLRLLVYTCAGGWEGSKGPRGVEVFRTLAVRQRLFDRALSYSPDLVIANGDHIYWDQRAWLEHANAEIRSLTRAAYDSYGYLDPDQDMMSGANEALLIRIGQDQIADLYGTRFRSLPCFFVHDDHDYFENDDAEETRVTFPPEDFNIRSARAVQQLFVPEHLPDRNRPAAMSGALNEILPGLNGHFGTVRYGRLLEAQLFDCARFMSLKGPEAGLVPPEVERWLVRRAAEADTQHLIHVPSHPYGWTAGKWREWYRDVVAVGGVQRQEGQVVRTHEGNQGGRLTTEIPKYLWQEGWHRQHQRLLASLSGQVDRAAVSISGDLHAIGHGVIRRSDELDLAANPVISVLAGPIGSSTSGWPSFARGIPPSPPQGLDLAQSGPPSEKNGFTLVDVSPGQMTFRQFAWREPDPVEAIDSLEPYSTFTVPVPRRA